MMGTSGGAVAGLAFATRHPDKITTLIAHEPPVTDLLPDAEPGPGGGGRDRGRLSVRGLRRRLGCVRLARHAPGSGAGRRRAARPPGRRRAPTTTSRATRPTTSGATPDRPPEPSAEQQADDELFFLRMLKPFTRYAPDVDALRDGPVRVRVAVGAASGPEVARRSAEALADRLGQAAVVFPSHHAGFMDDPAGFAAAVREVLATP